MARTVKSLVGFDSSLLDRRIRMDAILFADIDGVLHPEFCDAELRFCFMDQFCDAIRSCDPEQELAIVITSAWRLDTELPQLRSLFREDIAKQIVGVCPEVEEEFALGWGSDFRNCTGTREAEIKQWMQEYSPQGKWLAIDDKESIFRIGCPHLFLVPGKFKGEGYGLNAAVAVEFESRLKSFLG